jgi:hypothetical protein
MQEIFKKKCRYYNYAIIFTSSQQIVHRAKAYGYVPKTFPTLKNTTRKPQKNKKNLFLHDLHLRNLYFTNLQLPKIAVSSKKTCKKRGKNTFTPY